jgi:hypothetical protein
MMDASKVVRAGDKEMLEARLASLGFTETEAVLI